MAHFAQITSQALGTDYCNTPGAGAAGGLGFAFLSYLGATLTPGIELILYAVGLEQEKINYALKQPEHLLGSGCHIVFCSGRIHSLRKCADIS